MSNVIFLFIKKNNKAYLWSYVGPSTVPQSINISQKEKKIPGAHFRVEEIFSIPIQLTPIQVSFRN